MTLSDDVLKVLEKARCEGHELRIVETLDRTLYTKVNKALEAKGGKWNRSRRAHVFGDDARDAVENLILTGEAVLPPSFGFFETPPEIGLRLVEAAGVRDRHDVLEPSAGRGALVRLLVDRCQRLSCIELQPANVAYLRAAFPGIHSLREADFLETGCMPGTFDRVVMNPPFAVSGTRQTDILHVRHAFGSLAPGGRLATIMARSVLFRDNRLTSDFRDFVHAQGGSIEALPEDSFKASGTGVSTVLVTLEA